MVANRSAKVDIKIDFSESVEGTFADVTLRHDGSAQLKPLDIATKFPFHIKFIEIDTRTEAKQLRVPPVLATRLLKQEIESKIREFKALSPEHRLEQAGAALRTLRALVSDPFFAGADTEIAKKISAKAAEIEPKLAEFAQARKENVTTERDPSSVERPERPPRTPRALDASPARVMRSSSSREPVAVRGSPTTLTCEPGPASWTTPRPRGPPIWCAR